MMSDRKALALAFGTALTWGMAGIFIRLLPFPGLFITGLRLLIALVGLTPILILRRHKLAFADFQRGSMYFLAALMITYYLTAVLAFQMAPVAEVALLIAASPLLVLGTNTLRGIRVSRGEKIGAVMAVLGVACVLGPKLTPGSFDHRHVIGDLLALASAGCSAAFATFYGRARANTEHAVDAFIVSVAAMLTGGLALTMTASAIGQIDYSALTQMRYLVPALGLGLVSTAFPSVAYSTASQRLPAVVTTTIQLLIPIVSTIGAAIFLREIPSLWLIPGGLLVIGGIFTLVRSAQSREVAVEEELTNL